MKIPKFLSRVLTGKTYKVPPEPTFHFSSDTKEIDELAFRLLPSCPDIKFQKSLYKRLKRAEKSEMADKTDIQDMLDELVRDYKNQKGTVPTVDTYWGVVITKEFSKTELLAIIHDLMKEKTRLLRQLSE